jgi:putative zinc finger protein
MRCDEVRLLLSAGLDKELDGRCAADVRTHLAGCAACALERQALDATVRLLRAVPEVDPPAELRRRIGVALHEEVRRRSERRSLLALLGLALPRRTGWAWGASLGAAAAVVGLWSTLVKSPQRMVAVPATPLSVGARPRSADSSSISAKPAPARSETHKQSPPASRPTHDNSGALVATATESPLRPIVQSEPMVSVPAPDLPKAAPPRTSYPVIRRAPGGAPVAPRSAGGSSQHRTVPALHSYPSTRETPLVASAQPMPVSDSNMPDVPDEELLPESSGMTQMASGSPMPTAPATSSDDLESLRRRLSDRPLQVPQLGRLKTGDRRSGQDGWIRF